MTTTAGRQRIAIVGSGISGLACARALHSRHDITVFEARDRIGGHSNTVPVHEATQDLAIDTGFIVYNQSNYPLFSQLLESLGVATQPSEMSFSFTSTDSGLEYRASNINAVLARRRNLLRPSFLRMLTDIPRFNHAIRQLLASRDLSTSLEDFLAAGNYSRAFVADYLIPLGASIWSADPQRFGEFPVAPLGRFLERHGLLSIAGKPQWRTVHGGAREYVRALVQPFAEQIRISCPVRRIDRDDAGVLLFSSGRPDGERFDRVVLATHADTALSLLANPSAEEVSVLRAFRFQRNRATLHTDQTLLPRSRRAWASWNYRRVEPDQRVPVVTYHMNRLQRLTSASEYCVTLNSDPAIDPARVIASFEYSHPVFDSAALRAQQRHDEIDGRLRTHYCGAYWGYGFHEDGVHSAMVVSRRVLGTASEYAGALTR